MKTGAELIADERARHTDVEGWTPEHDDEHSDGELALAAVCYASPKPVFCRVAKTSPGVILFADPWPWDAEWDKRPYSGNVPVKPTKKQRVRLLVKAGALIAAEIDRLQRAKGTK